MQKDKVNKIIFLLLISTFSVFITACSNKKAADEICNLKFSWWGGNSRNEYIMEGIKHFHDLYPEINIKAEFTDWTTYEHNFEKSLRSKGCADIMQINFDWLSKYSQDGNGFYDLNELADYIELYNYTLDDLSYGMKNGKLNAIPIAFNAAIPVFNKKILDDNNLKIP